MARERKRPLSPERALERALTRKARPPSAPGGAAEQLRALEERYGREGARQRLGLSERQLRRWRAGTTGRPLPANAERLRRETERLRRESAINARREARLRNRGAYVHMTGEMGGGTPGAKRTNSRHRSIGGRGETSIHLTETQMNEITNLYQAGNDDQALEVLREAIADQYGWGSFHFEDLTLLEFLRDDPNE